MSQAPMPDDGYLRVDLTALRNLKPRHLATLQDEEAMPESFIRYPCGLTEWTIRLLASHQTVTIGWDWYINPISDRVGFVDEDFRTNLMLIDENGCDLGHIATAQSLRNWLSRFGWEEVIRSSLFQTLQ